MAYLLYYLFLITSLLSLERENVRSYFNQKHEEEYLAFNYKILSKDSLEYFQYLDVRKAAIKSTLLRNNAEYDVFTTIIDREYDISFYHFNAQKPDYSSTPFVSHDRDYLQVGNKKYIFDEIEYGKDYKKRHPSWGIILNTYKFSFNKKNYFLSFYLTTHNSTYPNYLVFLFDITIKKKPKLLLSEHQASLNIDCFGDFNHDSKLDYAYREQLGDKLICKTLEDGRFKELPNYYLTIIDSPHKPKIDLDKSNWFFDLSEN